MTRLIDADALNYSTHRECAGHGEYYEIEIITKSKIDNAPTIDAKPRLATRWIDADLDPDFAKCKNCSEHKVDIAYSKDFIKQERWNFCPYCGAKIDKERKP